MKRRSKHFTKIKPGPLRAPKERNEENKEEKCLILASLLSVLDHVIILLKLIYSKLLFLGVFDQLEER